MQRLDDPIPVLGIGVLQAFGRKRRLQIFSSDGQVTEQFRRDFEGGPEAFDEWRTEAERRLDRSVLRGPTDEGAPELENLGWDPTYASRIAEQRAQNERDQAQRLDASPHWRRGRLRDIVSARYLITDAEIALNEVLAEHKIRLADIASTPEVARSFTDSMPGGDAWISLVTAAHRNSQTKWTSNDIFDFDALAVAVPYCDAVVTDRHARHLLSAEGVSKRLEIEIFATLDELAAWL